MRRARVSKVFDETFHAFCKKPRYVSLCGGTRSGKTFSILQLLIAVAQSKRCLISVVSETFPHLKRGAIRDFKEILGDQWEDERWSKTDSIYTFPSGGEIEFFSADSPAKVHGPARDYLFLNEAQNIPYDTARQLFVRTKKRIIIDYNPTHSFWVNEQIEPREDCITIHSTYVDNFDSETGESFLSKEQIIEIESNKNDANWWRVYGEGKIGQLEGLIYDFEQIDVLPDTSSMVSLYGIDFGFTNDPTAIVHVYLDTRRRELYMDEVCYNRGMLNRDIAAALREQAITPGTFIFADSAEPKTIAELQADGFNVYPCYKATRKAEQIQRMKGYKMFVTKSSINLIRELRNYVWMKDKDGHMMNEPTPIGDHAMDAFRYAVFTYLTQCGGQYTVSIY